MKGNVVYALVGLGMVLAGVPALLFGIAVLLGLMATGLLGLGIPGVIVNLFNTLGIASLIAGILGTWLGIKLMATHGGKLFRITLGLLALLAAIVSAFLAVTTAVPTGFIGLFVFLVAMVFFLIVADWGLGTEFFTKFIKAVPVLGNIVVGVVTFTLPKK